MDDNAIRWSTATPVLYSEKLADPVYREFGALFALPSKLAANKLCGMLA
jgi:hypothetical protein